MNRRQMLQTVLAAIAAAGGLAMPDPDSAERLTRVLARPATIDPQTLDYLGQMTVCLSHLERTTPDPRLLIPQLQAHLAMLTELLSARGSLPPMAHRELCSLAGETSGLIGWMFWDLGQHAQAERQFTAGLKAAVASGDKPLGAYLIGCIASQPMHMEDPDRRLRVLSGQTMGVAITDATPHTLAWLTSLEAGAYALLGRMGDFETASDRVRTALAHVDDVERRRPRERFFTPLYAAESEATGLLLLDSPARAQAVLEPVMDDAYGRWPSWLALDMAKVGLQLNEPEIAAEWAMRALRDAQAAALEPVLANLRPMRRELLPQAHLPAVQEFADLARLA